MNKLTNEVRVLIFDDQVSREEDYLSFIKYINEVFAGKWILKSEFCSDPNKLFQYENLNESLTLVFVDMVLNTNGWTPKHISNLDKLLKDSKVPLMLVSGQFQEPAAIERVNGLIGDVTEGKIIAYQFVVWDWILFVAKQNGDAGQLAFVIDLLLKRTLKQNLLFSKNHDEPIDILHITDPHFGKCSWNIARLVTLTNKQNSRELLPCDFLAITGDIANTGQPEEYRNALDYFRALYFHNVVEGSDIVKERVVICPGNHDFYRPIALGANIHLENEQYVLEEKVTADYAWIRSCAWFAYEDFEKELTGQREHWLVDPGFRINTMFSHTGLIFLELNVERYDISGYQLGIDETKLKSQFDDAINSVTRARHANECLVILVHRKESDSWKELSVCFENMLAALATQGPVILLCGHHHSMKISLDTDDQVLVIKGTSALDENGIPKGTLPAVCQVRLVRNECKVIGANIYPFYQDANVWLERDPIFYEFNRESNRWRRV